MNVRPNHIKAAYVLLRSMPPFDRWNLPPAEEIKFELLRDPKAHAEYHAHKKHHIRINADTHLTLGQLMESVAHEMVHLKQELMGRLSTNGDGHNSDFRRMRKTVCNNLGFDVQKF